MEQVLVGEPSTRHLHTHRLILSRGLTLCSSHCWRPWGKLQKMKAWRRSAQPGQDTVVLMKVPISTPTFWSPDPACPGLLKSKRAGGEAAGVATPDAWERSPPPLQISAVASRAGPWGAGSSATTEEPLCFVAEFGLLLPCDVVGGWSRCLPCQLSTSEKPGCPSCLACALLRKLRQQSTSPRDLCLGP